MYIYLIKNTMKQELTKCQFHDAFKGHGRDDQFSYEGLNALYDWLENFYEECMEGQEYTLDVIALCCEYSEYDSLEDLRAEYPSIESMKELEYNTIVIPIEGTEGFIIQQF